ncbi:MAG TPA: hypothetical protein DDY91_19430 [Planctomycetaceae bacterium]|nr:hypothetical protein [Planctomycetaceae bacterium]
MIMMQNEARLPRTRNSFNRTAEVAMAGERRNHLRGMESIVQAVEEESARLTVARAIRSAVANRVPEFPARQRVSRGLRLGIGLNANKPGSRERFQTGRIVHLWGTVHLLVCEQKMKFIANLLLVQ